MSFQKLVRNLVRYRWALGAFATPVVAGIVYLVWGAMGLVGLGGGVIGVGIPLLLGSSKAWTAKDQAEHDRRWKLDGSSNDDGLSS